MGTEGSFPEGKTALCVASQRVVIVVYFVVD